MRYGKPWQMMIIKVLKWNKTKRPRPQPEITFGTHRPGMERQANARSEIRPRRQRGPPAMPLLIAPANPCRTPHVVRFPAPPQTIMLKPPAIMKGRPAPGIVGFPAPSAIGVNPSAAIEIGLPPRVDHDDSRLPAASVTFHVHPVSIRRERLIETSVIRIDDIWFRHDIFHWCVTHGQRRGCCHDRGNRANRRRQCGRSHRSLYVGTRIARSSGRNQHLASRCLKRVIPLKYCCYHGGGHTDVSKVNDLIGTKLEWTARVCDKRQHDGFFRT